MPSIVPQLVRLMKLCVMAQLTMRDAPAQKPVLRAPEKMLMEILALQIVPLVAQLMNYTVLEQVWPTDVLQMTFAWMQAISLVMMGHDAHLTALLIA